MSIAACKVAAEPDAASAPLQIVQCGGEARAMWDSYVARHPEGTFFHRYGWADVIADAYGYEPLYLMARRGGEIAGLLPLIDVKAPLLGQSLISTAFTVGGGPIGDDDEAVNALAQEAVRFGEERRVRYVELRGEGAPLDGWAQKQGVYAVFRKALPADEEENFNMMPKRRRADIRKALKSEQSGELRVRCDNDPDAFYALYARALRDHGTPIFPKRFLSALTSAFNGDIEFSFVDYQGKPVAGLLTFYDREKVLPYYIGAAPEARTCRAPDLIMWSLMRRAAARGATLFDFGRSKVGSGPYQFKKLWGFEATPLSYQYKLIAAAETPNVNPNNPKFNMFVKGWRRLPLTVANRAGPLLARNFP